MGSSRFFDDNADLIDIGDPSILQNLFDGGGTVSAWCYPTSISSLGRIVSKIGTGGWVFYFRSTSNSLSFFYNFFDFFSNDYREDSTSTPATNEWHNYAVTFDADSSSNRASFFLDGASYASTTGLTPGGNRVSDVGDDFVIGNTAAANGHMPGDLAYVQAWDRILSAEEIRESMYRPGTVKNGLIGFWPCLGDSPERDLSGNGNTGTVTGATISGNGPPVSLFT